MRYYDCFTYFSEIELLKVRLHELKPLNPIHVLVEAPYTHTGDPKELHFEQHKHLFSDFDIRHIVVDNMPNNGNAWDNENHQRDCILKGLYDCKDEDVVIISDLDEIPRRQAVQFYEPRMNTASLQQDKYSVYINLLEGIQNWGIAKITTWELLKQTTPNKLRNGGSNFSIYFGGWHISFLGGVEKMKEKLFSYAHTETLTSELLNNLEYKYETGQSLWANDFWKFVPIDKSFPKYIYENQHEFKHLIKQL